MVEDYLLGLMDLSVELGIKILPMFWGVAFGWELATGYPWGFWAGGDFDLIKEGQERFVNKTARIRACQQTGNCVGTWGPPRHSCHVSRFQHAWGGRAILHLVFTDAMSKISPFANIPLRMMEPNWGGRAMQFTDLPSGDFERNCATRNS